MLHYITLVVCYCSEAHESYNCCTSEDNIDDKVNMYSLTSGNSGDVYAWQIGQNTETVSVF